MQEIAWSVTLWLVLVLAAAFIYVVMKSGDKAEAAVVQGAAGKIRSVLFWVLLVAGVPVTMVTLADLPYAAATTEGESQVVDAVGSQWSWALSQSSVVSGRPVEFRVTAADASHGFAIYNSSMTLLAQTQAMPEYTNVLRYTFAEPGTYKVLCLEYCGVDHHNMMTEFTVVAP